MAKSHIQKKSAKRPKTKSSNIEQASTIATDYLKEWTRKELGKLHSERNPVCIPTKSGYKIGLYNLYINPNKTCNLSDPNSELVHTFDNKVNAVLYTIYTIKRRYYVADQIISLDKEINKNYVDTLTLRRGIELALAVKDYNKVDIKQARLEIAQKKLELAREQLSKIHKTAKYNKVWE